MKTAIAIMTYNRVGALKELLKGTSRHCSNYPLPIFEDCGYQDTTEAHLTAGATHRGTDHELEAEHYEVETARAPLHAFIGNRNLGVTGNTNRAIRWFMTQTDCDHLCVLNDDLHVLGDFPKLYSAAHEALGIGLFCFNDFSGEDYRWMPVKIRGFEVHVFRRMTGIMMSFTRDLVDKIGYYDADFGKFGEEHCDFTNRARFAGAMQLDGQNQACLDVFPLGSGGSPGEAVLRHQEAPTSMTGIVRARADSDATESMKYASWSYRNKDIFRPFLLSKPRRAGAYQGVGIPVDNLLPAYTLVQ